MGWIAIAIIFVVLLIIIFSISSSRRSRKSVSHQTNAVLSTKKSSKRIKNDKAAVIKKPFPENTDISILDDLHDEHKQKRRYRISKEANSYRVSDGSARTYAHYDWQRRYEESIMTPFPEEWSPALPFLHEAHRLEEEGASQAKVQEILEIARQIDSNATNFYIARSSIMKKVKSRRQQDRQ